MKRIIVTGDSGGLGHAIATSLLQDESKYFVIGISRRINENIEKLVSDYPNRYVHINFDLVNPDNIKDLYLEKLKPYKIGRAHV